ncbi:unnamed protein product [Phyllotreta striolata]|uniref:Uncharacterized protein n=1 Tax=Phyllotreta striolata TaxID=444603 RepID=A0A9N9TPN1_PHYSR|nr:unnamed protein product [Phyllotreta striolata]
MDRTLYFILFVLVSTAYCQSFSSFNESVSTSKGTPIVEPTKTMEFGASQRNVSIQRRQSEYVTSTSATSQSQNVGSSDLSPSEARRYYPYFRLRKMYSTHIRQESYPLSNYADPDDPDDKFPTVA